MPSSSIHSALTEADIRSFLQESPSLASYTKKALLLTGVACATLVLGFFLLNFSAYYRMQEVSRKNIVKPVAAKTNTLASVATPAPTPTATPGPNLPENTLSFTDLNIAVPVNWDVVFQEKEIQSKLTEGVVHLKGTARPGETGTVIITGHSSNYPWAKGSFNNIFAPLQKAVAGEEFFVRYQGVTYGYRVSKIYEVKPTQTEVLKAGEKSGLRLITCTPIGTSLRRLVVEADQFLPNPELNTPFKHSDFNGDLPAIQ